MSNQKLIWIIQTTDPRFETITGAVDELHSPSAEDGVTIRPLTGYAQDENCSKKHLGLWNCIATEEANFR